MNNLPWRKSTYSGSSGSCVEVAELADGSRLVRDTKNREGGTLKFTAAEWCRFTAGIKAS